MQNGKTAQMWASTRGHLDVVNRLMNFQKTVIREGFELLYSHGSLDVPADLVEVIAEFAIQRKKKTNPKIKKK